VARVCSWCGLPDPDWLKSLEPLGTALKPSHEPIIVARKPLEGTVAANIQTYGTGALNIDACRVGTDDDTGRTRTTALGVMNDDGWQPKAQRSESHAAGRWPANVVLDGAQADALDQMSGITRDGVAVNRNRSGVRPHTVYGEARVPTEDVGYGGAGGASRFFHVIDEPELPAFSYQAKAPTKERPSYVKEGAGLDDAASIYASKPGRQCNVCGSRGKPSGGDQSGKPWPTCGHDDWTWVEQQTGPAKVAHPTCKPLTLIRLLVRLVTPPGGTVVDPFAGSGTTVEACILEGFDCIAIEREADYLPLIRQRIDRHAGTLPFEEETA